MLLFGEKDLFCQKSLASIKLYRSTLVGIRLILFKMPKKKKKTGLCLSQYICDILGGIRLILAKKNTKSVYQNIVMILSREQDLFVQEPGCGVIFHSVEL